MIALGMAGSARLLFMRCRAGQLAAVSEDGASPRRAGCR